MLMYYARDVLHLFVRLEISVVVVKSFELGHCDRLESNVINAFC